MIFVGSAMMFAGYDFYKDGVKGGVVPFLSLSF